MAKRRRAKKSFKIEWKVFWFLLLLIFAALGSIEQFVSFISIGVVWLVLGILGAIVALLDVRKREEYSFLLGTIGLMIIIMAFTVIPKFAQATGVLGDFLINLGIGFGSAGLVVALSLIARVGLRR
jgi:hypothetical protein